jgi:hypothetical protein
MCGPSAAQEQLQSSQAQFYDQLRQQDSTQYGEDQAILTQMQSVYAPILAAGPDQFGFTQAESNDLNTQATEGVATNYANAGKALREEQASEGGGNSYLPSGVNEQEKEQLAESASGQQSTEQQQIRQAGYQQGYNKFVQASSALQGTAALLNPNGAANAANAAGSAEGTTAAQIAAENESWMAPLAGAVGAVGGAATAKFLK